MSVGTRKKARTRNGMREDGALILRGATVPADLSAAGHMLNHIYQMAGLLQSGSLHGKPQIS